MNIMEKEKNTKKQGNKNISISSETFEMIKEVKGLIERKKEGIKTTYDKIIYHSIKQLNENDINKVFESSLSLSDKIDLEFGKYRTKNGVDISRDEFIAKKLKIIP